MILGLLVNGTTGIELVDQFGKFDPPDSYDTIGAVGYEVGVERLRRRINLIHTHQ